MKKIIPTILLALNLLISACASTQPATESAAPQIVEEAIQNPAAQLPAAPQESGQSESNILNADYENAVSVAMQLLLGTIRLEGTANAITTEQAATLIPLWTNFKSLSESMRHAQGVPGQGQGQPNATPQPFDSGLQTQLDEIIKQIQSAMTTEQVQAIANMKITQEMYRTIMDEQGITVGEGQQGKQGNGGMDGGGQPLAGGDMPQGAPPAGGMQPNGVGFIPSELIDALIELLGQK